MVRNGSVMHLGDPPLPWFGSNGLSMSIERPNLRETMRRWKSDLAHIASSAGKPRTWDELIGQDDQTAGDGIAVLRDRPSRLAVR
jgi:hypothetical protein